MLATVSRTVEAGDGNRTVVGDGQGVGHDAAGGDAVADGVVGGDDSQVRHGLFDAAGDGDEISHLLMGEIGVADGGSERGGDVEAVASGWPGPVGVKAAALTAYDRVGDGRSAGGEVADGVGERVAAAAVAIAAGPGDAGQARADDVGDEDVGGVAWSGVGDGDHISDVGAGGFGSAGTAGAVVGNGDGQIGRHGNRRGDGGGIIGRDGIGNAGRCNSRGVHQAAGIRCRRCADLV